jgi:DNA-binding NarL/FixJ family response regulator
MATIILADDHVMFRQSLRKILTIENIADVVAEASNGKELLTVLETVHPDLILMDIAMPIMDGIEATKRVLEKNAKIKILALSSFGEDKYYFSMLEAGAKGFVAKNAQISELANAIYEVTNGGNWFSVELIQRLISTHLTKNKLTKTVIETLSDREMDVLKLICESFTNDQIASKLFISFDTVKWHRSNLLIKTHSSNTAGLVVFAIKNKIIEL